MAPEVVCVTGVTGYIAAHIVRDLLALGYHVRGTVRSVKNHEKLAPLRALPGAAERLTFVEADLMKDSDFSAILEGCTGGLIHTATPIEIPLDGKPPAATEEEAQLKQIGPAVEGTKKLLRAAARQGVPKVVLTSSIAAMRFTPTTPAVLNETCWSDEEFMRKSLFSSAASCYALAKTLQEREATRLAAELKLKLVVINPALVIGPTLTPGNHNFSLALLVGLMEGKGSCFEGPSAPGTLPDKVKAWCDVREVSEAHVKALTNPHASGRYLVQSHGAHYAQVAEEIRGARWWLPLALPALPVDSPDGQRHAVGGAFDNSRTFGSGSPEQLGVRRVALRDSVRGSVDALLRQGHFVGRLKGPACAAAAAAVAVAGLMLSRRATKA